MSPSYWYWESRTDDYISFVFYVGGSDYPGHLTRNGVLAAHGVRPVISLEYR